MAQDAQLVVSDVGSSWEQGPLLVDIDAVNFSTGKTKTFPKGSVVRLYKGTFTADNSPLDFKSPKIDHVRPSGEVVDLWLLEAAPAADHAWLVYTEDQGLPATYQQTWYGVYKEGLTRLFAVPVGKGASLDAAGFPAGLLNSSGSGGSGGDGGGGDGTTGSGSGGDGDGGGGGGGGGDGGGGGGNGNGGGNGGDSKGGSGLLIGLAVLAALALLSRS